MFFILLILSLSLYLALILQFEYDDWLAAQCGHPPIEEWRKLMYESTSMNRRAQPEKYRDEWDDDHLVTQAEQSFKCL